MSQIVLNFQEHTGKNYLSEILECRGISKGKNKNVFLMGGKTVTTEKLGLP